MRIVSHHSALYNMISYCFLSVMTIYVAMAFSRETSALNIYFFYDFIKSHHLIFLLFGPFIIFALSYSKWSFYFYHLAFFITAALLFTYLYENFNKVILFIIFFYCVLAYFLGQGWKQILGFSCYNPNILKNEIDDPIYIKIEVKVQMREKFVYEGILTNWDEISCFIQLDGEIEEKLFWARQNSNGI